MISKDRIVMQQQIFNFLRSVTIKYSAIADLQNATLVAKGYAVDDQNPATWKYYVNMAGQYHVSDTKMYVTSLDTHASILFSPETLALNPRTRSVYQPGGIYYDRLCAQYPQNVDLIKSILFPVTDITKAILADDFTLLNYSSGYLEEWEEKPIIMEIEQFLKTFVDRWHFDFLAGETYFPLATISNLTVALAMLIMSARESYIRTPYVHSFHLWSYLISKGLDDYSDILDRKKSMMLYQNIDYLVGNAGKQSNLIILANALLADDGVSLYGRKVVQEAQTGAADYQLTPQLEAFKIPLSNAAISTEIGSETVENIQAQVYAKGLTLDKTTEAAQAKARILSDTTLNEYNTKFLEIRPLTKNKIYSDTLNMFLLETLTVSIANGYYANPVTVTDTSTQVSLYLYPKELLAIYHYASLRAIGITPTVFPTKAECRHAFKTVLDTPTKTIMRNGYKIYLSQYVNTDQYFSDLQYDTQIEDPSDFSAMLERLWLRYMDHLLRDESTKIDKVHYIYQYLFSLCHKSGFIDIDLVPDFATYQDWFGISGIDIKNSVVDLYDVQSDPMAAWGNLADSIMTALVPITTTLDFFGNFTLSDFGFERLRQLFTQLCSYQVVFLESSRDTPQFAGYAKTSSDYGGVIVTQNDDYIGGLVVSKTHLVNAPMTITPLRGFTEEEKNTTAITSKYTVNSTLELADVAVAAPMEKNVHACGYTGPVISTGVIKLGYTPTIPVGVSDGSSIPYLIDIDGTILGDLDGSSLVDPDQSSGS